MSVKQYCFGKIFYNFNEFSVLSSTPSRFDTQIVAKPGFSVNLTVFSCLLQYFVNKTCMLRTLCHAKYIDFENN